jgi:ferredoxin
VPGDAPDLFELGGAIVSVKTETVPAHLEDAAREAEVLCPARAILLAD